MIKVSPFKDSMSDENRDPFWGDMLQASHFKDWPWGTVCDRTEQQVSYRLDIFKTGIGEELYDSRS